MFQENLLLVLLGLSLFFGTLGVVGLIVEYFFSKPTQKTDNYWSFYQSRG